MNLVKYFVETIGSELPSVSIKSAVRSENLDLVKYLIEEHGLKADIHDVKIASKSTNFKLKEYMNSLDNVIPYRWKENIKK